MIADGPVVSSRCRPAEPARRPGSAKAPPCRSGPSRRSVPVVSARAGPGMKGTRRAGTRGAHDEPSSGARAAPCRCSEPTRVQAAGSPLTGLDPKKSPPCFRRALGPGGGSTTGCPARLGPYLGASRCLDVGPRWRPRRDAVRGPAVPCERCCARLASWSPAPNPRPTRGEVRVREARRRPGQARQRRDPGGDLRRGSRARPGPPARPAPRMGGRPGGRRAGDAVLPPRRIADVPFS